MYSSKVTGRLLLLILSVGVRGPTLVVEKLHFFFLMRAATKVDHVEDTEG
jgi:hypothetical protein